MVTLNFSSFSSSVISESYSPCNWNDFIMSETLFHDPKFPKYLLTFLMENQKLLKYPRLSKKISYQRLLAHFNICANSFREKNKLCKKYNLGHWERFRLKDKYFWKWIKPSHSTDLTSYLPFWDAYSFPCYSQLSLKANLVLGLIFKRSSPTNQFTLRFSNQYFAQHFNYSTDTISEALKELSQQGLIKLISRGPRLIPNGPRGQKAIKTLRYIQLSDEMIAKRTAHLKTKTKAKEVKEVEKISLHNHTISTLIPTKTMFITCSIHKFVKNFLPIKTHFFLQNSTSNIIINDCSPFCFFKNYSHFFLKRIKLKKIVKNNDKNSLSSDPALLKSIKRLYSSGTVENVHNSKCDSKNFLPSPQISSSFEDSPSVFSSFEDSPLVSSSEGLEESPSVFSCYSLEKRQKSLNCDLKSNETDKSKEKESDKSKELTKITELNNIKDLTKITELNKITELEIQTPQIQKPGEEIFRLCKEENKAQILENPEKDKALREVSGPLKAKDFNPFSFHVFPEKIEKSLTQLFYNYPCLLTFVKNYGLAKALSLNEELVETLKMIVKKVRNSPAVPQAYLQGYIRNEFLYLEAKKVHKKREEFARELHKQSPTKYKLIKFKEQLIGIETDGMQITIWGISPFWNTHNLSYKEYFTQNHLQTLLPRIDLQIQDLKEWSEKESVGFQRYIIKRYERSSLGAIGMLKRWYLKHLEVYKEKYEIKEKETAQYSPVEQRSPSLLHGLPVEVLEKRLAIGRQKVHNGEWFWDHATKTFKSSYFDKNPLKAGVSVKAGDEYSEKIWRELGA